MRAADRQNSNVYVTDGNDRFDHFRFQISAIRAVAAKAHFSRIADYGAECSDGPLPARPAEYLRHVAPKPVVGATAAKAPFLPHCVILCAAQQMAAFTNAGL